MRRGTSCGSVRPALKGRGRRFTILSRRMATIEWLHSSGYQRSTGVTLSQGKYRTVGCACADVSVLSLDKLKGSGIQAIAQSRRLRPVLEDMAQMGIALAAEYLCPEHGEAVIGLGVDVCLVRRGVEARPAGPGVELGVRGEEFASAAYAKVLAFFVVVPILSGKRPLGTLLSRHPVLFPRELPFPFFISLCGLLRHGPLFPPTPGPRAGKRTCRCPNLKLHPGFYYSTVTLLARFRGWSTSHPRRMAM